MSIASWPPRLETTPVGASLKDAVFEPEALEAALEGALSQMLEGANLVAPSLQAQGMLIIVPEHGPSGLALKQEIRRFELTEATIAPALAAEQLGLALATKDPIEVSALWAGSRIRTWARALGDAISPRAALALITGDVRGALVAAAAGKTRRRVSISTWLTRGRDERKAREAGFPCLIGRLGAANGKRLPSFCVETGPAHRIPKKGEFLTLNLEGFAPTGRCKAADADVEIVEGVSRAAAAAFLAARCGARAGSSIPFHGRRVQGHRMESWLDVLRFIVSASGIVHASTLSDSRLMVAVDSDAGTTRLAGIDGASAHGRAALRRGIRQPTIVRDPADFMPGEGILWLGHCIATAAMDALIENEERLAAQSPRGWRAAAFERALRTLAFQPAQGGGVEGDWQGLRLLQEHCRRTGKNVDDFIPREAVPDALRKVQAPGVHFSAALCAAAERRARLPAHHPDRLWMITGRQTSSGASWHAVIGPDLRRVPIEWLQTALMLDDAVEKDQHHFSRPRGAAPCGSVLASAPGSAHSAKCAGY